MQILEPNIRLHQRVCMFISLGEYAVVPTKFNYGFTQRINNIITVVRYKHEIILYTHNYRNRVYF